MSSTISADKLQIYEQIKDKYETGSVKSYDKRLLLFLDTYTDKANMLYVEHYLDAINSGFDFEDAPRFTRYLALGMEWECIGKFSLYEGRLNSFDGKQHCWIETDDSVYDVMFRGKWPKDLYYEVFKAEVEKEVDLSIDDDYLLYKENNVKSAKIVSKSNGELRYVDWYSYELSSDLNKSEPLTFEFSPSAKRNIHPLDFNDYINIQYLRREGCSIEEIVDILEDSWNEYKNIEFPAPQMNEEKKTYSFDEELLYEKPKKLQSSLELKGMLEEDSTIINEGYTPRK